MNLNEIRAKGGFVSPVPVQEEIEWTHADPESGEIVTDKFTVGVRKQAFGLIERMFVGSDDKSKSASLISQCILFDGEEMSYEDAFQLDPGLAHELVKAINKVNSHEKAKPKN